MRQRDVTRQRRIEQTPRQIAADRDILARYQRQIARDLQRSRAQFEVVQRKRGTVVRQSRCDRGRVALGQTVHRKPVDAQRTHVKGNRRHRNDPFEGRALVRFPVVVTLTDVAASRSSTSARRTPEAPHAGVDLEPLDVDRRVLEPNPQRVDMDASQCVAIDA